MKAKTTPESPTTQEASAPERSTAVAIADPRFEHFDANFGSGAIVDNFPKEGLERLRLTSLALSGASEPGGDLVNEDIQFVYWFIQHIQLVDERTGEVNDAPRTVLIDETGNAFHFVSFGVYTSLRTILQFYGVGILKTAVKVKIKQRRTRKGWNVLYLEPVV